MESIPSRIEAMVSKYSFRQVQSALPLSEAADLVNMAVS